MTRPSVLVALIVVLLAALTALQYRWIGELSDFQRQQMERNLRGSTDRFVRDLEREFEQLWYVLNVRGSRSAGEEIAQDYAEWLESSDYPRLVADVYWVRDLSARRDDAAADRLDIERISLADGTSQTVSWPAILQGLREPLVASADAHRRRDFHRSDSFTAQLDGTALAFVVAQTSLSSKNWGIAVLRREVLTEQLLPALVRSHFGADEEREYEVRIFDAAAGDAPLYLSSAGSPVAAGASDFTRHFRDFGGVPIEREGEDNRSLAVAVTHRAGSVDAAVAQLRRRNLGFSFGVVVVLAASVGVLGIAARRAHRLAKRQMEFVAGVSHELRTPIAGISSLSQNLADGIVQDLQQAARYGETIHKESRRLGNMVEGVLHFSAIRSGRYRYAMEKIDFGDVVTEALDAIDPKLLENRSLDVDIEADLAELRGDARALRSVVRNLVSNALKFSGKGGKTRLSVTMGGSRRWPELELCVQDSGPGIGSAEVAHIFEPFFRGRAAQAQQIEGSGLGLSLVKEIVDAHGGHIEVSSGSGAGSLFRVHLPIGSRRPATAATDTPGETVEAQSTDPVLGVEGLAGDGGDVR